MPPPKRLVVASVNLGQSGSSKCVGCLLAKLVLSTSTTMSTSAITASWHIDRIIKACNIRSDKLNALLCFSNRFAQSQDVVCIGSHSRLNCIDSACYTLQCSCKVCLVLSGLVAEPNEQCDKNDYCDDVQSNVLSPSSSIIVLVHNTYMFSECDIALKGGTLQHLIQSREIFPCCFQVASQLLLGCQTEMDGRQNEIDIPGSHPHPLCDP